MGFRLELELIFCPFTDADAIVSADNAIVSPDNAIATENYVV